MNLEQYLKRKPHDALSEAFKQSYLATDGQLRRQNILRSGTTSVTCVVRKELNSNKRMLFTANVGDSRAILVRNNDAIRLTIDHKASLPEEAKRIQDAGGFIGRNKRVNGVLAISRALGDHMLKENTAVVSAEPYCVDTELTDADSYVILACDGVWDVMTDQYAVTFVLEQINKLQPQLDEYLQNNPDTNNNNTNNNSTVAMSSHDKIESDVVMSYADNESLNNEQTNNNINNKSDEITKPKNWNDLLYLVCKALVQEALDKRSLDNVTVLIVKL